MRLHSSIGGYVITEFTDVHWECNGLMDMQRQVKQGLDVHFTPLNQTRVIVARPHRWSGRPGESIDVTLRAFGADGAARNGTIQWQAGDEQGELAAPGGVAAIRLATPGTIIVRVTWSDAAGKPIAHNQVELVCVEPTVPAVKLNVIDDAALAATLTDLGYQVANDMDALLVATVYTAALQEAVQQGASLLLLVSPTSLDASDRAHLPTCQPIARAGTGWQGDWATSFSWLRKTGPFATLPGNPLLEMEYTEIMPDVVLSGIPARSFPNSSWASLALGWIHKPVSLLHKAPYGNGEIVTTTFKLTSESLQENVVAQALFAGCVELAAM
jgi:hypothetical protein